MEKIDWDALIGDQITEINTVGLAVGLVMTALLCYTLGRIYIKYGSSFSNRSLLLRSLVIVGVTTALIISIVKSSLALSLGLVGALSIIRFRTAIKEPEELAFFFISISIGLGMGAEQFIPTLIGTAIIFSYLLISKRGLTQKVYSNLLITLGDESDQEKRGQSIIELVSSHAKKIDLRRLESQGQNLEMAFQIEFSSHEDLFTLRAKLKETYPDIKFSFLENK
jgi:uncharacterized membrane protein YhiD involved in acid resistance